MKNPGSILGSYQAKLQDPRWREFSREIKDQKGRFCEICKRGDLTTEVHHWFYDFDREPWAYLADEVAVLCTSCHKEMHAQLKMFRKHVFSKMNSQQFAVLNGALKMGFEKYDPLALVHAIAELISTPSMIQRYATAWGAPTWKKTEEQLAYEQFRRSITGNATGDHLTAWACQNCGRHWPKEERPSMWSGFPFCEPSCAKEWDEDRRASFEELKKKSDLAEEAKA